MRGGGRSAAAGSPARPRPRRFARLLAAALGLGALAAGAERLAAEEDDARPNAAIFEEAWRLFRDNFYHREMHGLDWEEAKERHIAQARRASSQAEVHEAIVSLLGELEASHASLIEPHVYEHHFEPEGKRKLAPMHGLTLVDLEEGFFVAEVLHGGPAEAAGVLLGDRLVAIDGRPVDAGALWPGYHDPGLGGPRHYFLPATEPGEAVRLELERFPDDDPTDERLYGVYAADLRAHAWSQQEAGRASQRIFERHGFQVGYMRLYHVLSEDVPAMLGEFLTTDLAEADGVVIDLRGKGGLPTAIERVLSFFDEDAGTRALWGKPAVALIDGQTRSAKEILAFEWRRRELGPLVGTTTAGAVLGAQFHPLSDGSYLLLPVLDMRAMTGGVVLEGEGVAPDYAVEVDVRWARGRDDVLEGGLDVMFDLLLAERRRGKRHGWY